MSESILSVRPNTSRQNASLRRWLTGTTFLVAVFAVGEAISIPVLAQSLPSGGDVVAGVADISSQGPTMVVRQSTDKAIINWSDFSIGEGKSVDFQNGSGATLNRVTGANLSTIDGLLSSTGSVYLINPNGVIIGKSGTVRVGGDFVASTLGISNSDFLSGGDKTFSGETFASVINLGEVGSLGGNVALLAAQVRNEGSLNAPKGNAGLIAGSRILMRDTELAGGRFLVLAGGSQTTVSQTGLIEAVTAELRSEGGNIYALAGNTQGLIRATGVTQRDGRIFLSASGGQVEIKDTTLTATGESSGGQIDITGKSILVSDTALLEASGVEQGGQIKVIADMHGGDLRFNAKAVARGAKRGGFIETSGHSVNYNGALIDTAGAKSGTWLIDPEDITIDADAASTIEANLLSTNVVVQTTSSTASGPGVAREGQGDIIVDADIRWGSANTLTLDAFNAIRINANLIIDGAGALELLTQYGDYSFALGKSLTYSGANGGGLSINGTNYALVYDVADLSNLNGSSDAFALANDLTLSGPLSQSLVQSFSGTLTGLGHSINNLNIADTSQPVGFVSETSGTLRDLVFNEGIVSGDSFVGAVAGINNGLIKNVYSRTSVEGQSQYIGGLAGQNNGEIYNSVSAGRVNASFADQVGGLAGNNNGTIHAVVVSAPVKGRERVGGVSGTDGGGTYDAVVTGLVTGAQYVGGISGSDDVYFSGAFYDPATTGLSPDIGYALDTSSLQSASFANSMDMTYFTAEDGLYPYLKSFFPNGQIVVAGFASDKSAGRQISLYNSGISSGSVLSGANGYYYMALAKSSLSGSVGVTEEDLNDPGNLIAAGFADVDVSAISPKSLNLRAGSLRYFTSAARYSDVDTSMFFRSADAFGSLDATVQSAFQYNGFALFGLGDFSIDATPNLGGVATIGATGGTLSIDRDITIGSHTTLKLASDKMVVFNANVAGTSGATIALEVEESVSRGFNNRGNYLFSEGKSLTPNGADIFINGNLYTLIHNAQDLMASNCSYCALSRDINFENISGGALLFDRVLTGLGHSIYNINFSPDQNYSRAIFQVNTGVIRDLSISGRIYMPDLTTVGSLVSQNSGVIWGVTSTIDVTGLDGVGGLVGSNGGWIGYSHASGNVTGRHTLGGLAGYSTFGAVSFSYATGSVTSNANGVQIGGLVGYTNGGEVKDSFATGNIYGANSDVGGLIGYSSFTDINRTYATGSVYASGSAVGGLIGRIFRIPMANSYATGAVFGSSRVGGLVGDLFWGFGFIKGVYATGYVSGNDMVGGLFGSYDNTLGIVDSYWDVTNSGTNQAIGATYNPWSMIAIMGLNRGTLQSGALFSGFDGAVWGTGSGLYPYLRSLNPTGVKAITGSVSTPGAAGAKGSTVNAFAGGNILGSGSVGADGQFYIQVSPSSLNGLSALGLSQSGAGQQVATGYAYTTNPSVTGNRVQGGSVEAGVSNLTTSQTTFSGLSSFLQSVFGANAPAVTQTDGVLTKITSTGAFRFDTASSFGGGLSVLASSGITVASDVVANGDTTFSSPITLASDASINSGVGTLTFNGRIDGAHSLTVRGAALTINAPIGGISPLSQVRAIATNGDINLNAPISTTQSILLAANGRLLNTAGASALSAGTSFIVYTQDPSDRLGQLPINTYNGLSAVNYYNDAFDFTQATFASVVPTGNHFVFAYEATLTPTLSGSARKTYDAGVAADISNLSVSGGTLLSQNDTVSLSFSGAEFDDQNAGVSKGVTATGITLTSNPNNYRLIATTATAQVGQIDKAALTLTAGSDQKTYDATTASSGTVSVTGLKGSDSVTNASQAFDSKNAGGRTLTVTGYTLNDGNNGGNYTVTTQTASGQIDKAALTLTAGSDQKTYDATTASSGTVSVTGLKGSDSVTNASQAFDSKNAGGRTLTVTGYTLNDGNNGGNYTVTTQTASGQIDKAALTLTAGSDQKTYDATTASSGTVSVTGLKGSDSVTNASQAFDSKNAG
ncbi:YDG domain-containing protein, partial [Asticcacaulis sp. DXS10W]